MTTNPYESPHQPSSDLTRGGFRPWKRRIITGVFVFLCLGVVVLLLLPAQRGAPREAARRNGCRNNLRQIALALRAYEASHGSFPPAYTVDAQGKPLHSWRTLILPYIEEEVLYRKLDLSKPWDDPVNMAVFELGTYVYHCPSVFENSNRTTYLAVIAPGSCLSATEARKLADVGDDLDLVLLVVDVDAEHAVPWMSPQDASESTLCGLTESANLQHGGMFQAITVSGRVVTVPKSISPEALRAFLSIAGDDDEIIRRALD